MLERTETFEGSWNSEEAPLNASPTLAQKIKDICNDLMSHFHKFASKLEIKRVILTFKVDVKGDIWFLWCNALRVVSRIPNSLDILRNTVTKTTKNSHKKKRARFALDTHGHTDFSCFFL